MVRVSKLEKTGLASGPVPLKQFGLAVAFVLTAEAGANIWLALVGGPGLPVLAALRAVEIFGLLCLFYWIPPGLSALGLDKASIGPGIFKGLLWSLGFALVVVLGFLCLYAYGKNPFALFKAKIPKAEFWLYLLTGGLIGPVAEELFFRGVLYGFLRRWGIFVALFSSSLIFVFMHGSGGFTQAVGGILFAVSYEREGKLMVPIVIHVSGNLALFGISLLTF